MMGEDWVQGRLKEQTDDEEDEYNEVDYNINY